MVKVFGNAMQTSVERIFAHEYPASRGPSIFLDKSGRGRDLCQPPRLSHPPKRMSHSGLKPVFPVFAECACALLEIAG